MSPPVAMTLTSGSFWLTIVMTGSRIDAASGAASTDRMSVSATIVATRSASVASAGAPVAGAQLQLDAGEPVRCGLCDVLCPIVERLRAGGGDHLFPDRIVQP